MLKEDFYEYWTVRKDYSQEPFFTFDQAMLREDIGDEMADAWLSFLSAHYPFNDKANPPSSEQEVELINTMNEAIAILGEDFPRFLYVDTLNALQAGVITGETQFSPTDTGKIKYHGFEHYD